MKKGYHVKVRILMKEIVRNRCDFNGELFSFSNERERETETETKRDREIDRQTLRGRNNDFYHIHKGKNRAGYLRSELSNIIEES